ncbi:MAG: LLM class flavin-dependent oxidoreductase [Aeromicrobium sp.]
MAENDASRRIGVFIVPPVAPHPGDLYRRILTVARTVERSGFDSFWLAEGHFTHIGVSSSLSVLAAASQVTSRIALGTAVVPLAFDHPLRLAETAATVNTLSGGRLQLGVGKGNGHGFSAQAYDAFRLDENDRDAIYARALDSLRGILVDGAPVGDALVPVYPPTEDLRDRIWQATSSRTTAVAAAAAGDGLQLHRIAFGADTGTAQRELVDAYLGAYAGDRPPRIAVSRGVFASSSRQSALAEIQQRIDRPDLSGPLPLVQDGQDAAAYVAASNTHIGSADDIVTSLLADPTVQAAGEILLAPVHGIDDSAFDGALSVLADGVAAGLRSSSDRLVTR